MGGGQSLAGAADMARLKTQNEKLRDQIEALQNKGKKKHTIVVKDSGAEKRFERPQAVGRRIEVSAEVAGKVAYAQKTVEKPTGVKEMLGGVVQSSVLFKNVGDQEKNDSVGAFYQVEAKTGEVVIKQGDVGHNFYVVESGSLEVTMQANDNAPVVKYASIGPGQAFGDLALLYNTPRAATITATADSSLWILDRSTYQAICLHYKRQRAQKHIKFLKNVPDLKNLTGREVAQLAEAMEEETHEAGSTIILQGEKGDHFYIIVEGEVVVTKDGAEVATKVPAEFFGEKALISEDVRAATCTAKGSVTLLSINRSQFNDLLGSLVELLKREGGGEEEDAVLDAGDATQHKDHKKIMMDDLDIKATLGCGAFGRVKLVKHKETGETYALKCQSKADIVSNQLQDHVIDERNVMLVLDHPFILKLHNTYKDDKYIYFLLELALGGEMFTFLRKAGRFNEKASRFYATSVVLAFEQMHNKSIVYRDLKPENLLLDSQGFLKVVDFGLAKVVNDRTWTLCGTPDYLAPEIILSKGHDRAVDYWALGVLIYEMCAGFVPYYSDDPMEVYQLILGGDLKFPSHFSRAAMDLITKLMNQNQAKRLGNMKNGVKDIIKHKWFSGFDWDGLLSKSMTPPIQPVVKNPEDMSNYDEYPEDEGSVPVCMDWDPEI